MEHLTVWVELQNLQVTSLYRRWGWGGEPMKMMSTSQCAETHSPPLLCLIPVNCCHLLNGLRSPPQSLRNSEGLAVSSLPDSPQLWCFCPAPWEAGSPRCNEMEQHLQEKEFKVEGERDTKYQQDTKVSYMDMLPPDTYNKDNIMYVHLKYYISLFLYHYSYTCYYCTCLIFSRYVFVANNMYCLIKICNNVPIFWCFNWLFHSFTRRLYSLLYS